MTNFDGVVWQEQIIEAAADGIVTLDRASRFVSANAAAIRILGVTRAELIGQSSASPPYRRLTLAGEPRADRPTLGELDAAGDQVFHDEYIIERRNGTRVFLSRNITALRDAAGQFLGAVSTFTDITAQKGMIEALHQSEARIAFLLKLSDALRPLVKPDWVQATVTRTAMDYFGADRCYYCEITDGNAIIRQDASRDDLPSVVGSYSLYDLPIFKTIIDAGHPFIVNDVHHTDLVDEALRQLCIQLQIISFIDVPVIKNERPVGILCLAQSFPREWTPFELTLVEEVADRAWSAVERAQAETSVRESEARYRTLFNAMDEGACLFERLPTRQDGLRDYRYIAMNPAMQAMFGIPDLSGQSIRDSFPAEAEAWYDDYDRVLESGQSIRFVRESAPQGKVLEMFVTRVQDGFGRQLLSVMQDITVRRRAEVALRESEQRLQLALDAADMGTLIWNVDADHGEPDARMLSLLGLPHDGVIDFANMLGIYVNLNDRARIYNAAQQALNPSGLGQFREDVRVLRPDQTERWLSCIGHTLFEGEPRRAVQLIVVAMDVSSYKRAEATMRESEERFRLLVEGTKEYAMFRLDTQGRIVHWNSGAERVFGYTRDQAMGQNAAMVFTPEDQDTGVPQRELENAAMFGQANDQRWHLRCDGSRFWASGVMSSLRDEQGDLRGFVKIARDVTHEREAEEALQRAYSEMEARVVERTTELQASQEQLRQLLLRTEHVREEERFRIAREVHDELGGALTGLKFGVHQIGRNLSEGSALTLKTELDTQIQDLVQIVRRIAAELHTPVLDDFGLTAAIEWQANDWSAKTGIACQVELPTEEFDLEKIRRVAMFRVFQETLTNIARHATGATLVKVTIEMQASEIRLTVADNGCGIDLERLQPGKSLGLLNMRERMREVDGSLAVVSAVGEGMTIIARMPVRDS